MKLQRNMPHERLAIERATWAVAIKTRLQDDFSLREFLNDYSTTFVVKSDATPDWQVKITVCSAHNARNRVELDGKVLSYSFSSRIRDKLVNILNEHRTRHAATLSEAKRAEMSAQAWAARQQEELKDLPEMNTLNTTIVRSGPYAGHYAVAFFPGHPLEHLTLEQVKAFYAFLQSLSSKTS